MSDKIGQVIENIEECGTKFVRLQFVDIHGTPKNYGNSVKQTRSN